MVEMDIWDAAKAVAAEQLRGARSDLIRLESEAEVRAELLATLRSQVRFEAFDSVCAPHMLLLVSACS